MKDLLSLTLLSTLLAAPALAQESYASVDVYGLRTLQRAALFEVLGLEEVRTADSGVSYRLPGGVDRSVLEERLCAIEGIEGARVMRMMAPKSKGLMIGIREVGAAPDAFRAEPTADVALPGEMLAGYERAMELSYEGLKKGVAGEDAPDGFALSQYGPARKVDEQLAAMAKGQMELLCRVLTESSDSKSRAVAAHLVPACMDKAAAVAALARAGRDADASVRNNAVRALSVLMRWADQQPVRPNFDLEHDFLISMLDSLSWTDRNKGASLLDVLSQARTPELMSDLRERALPALEEMALWSSRGHAGFSVRILARLAGLDEAEVEAEHKALWKRDQAGNVQRVAELLAAVRQAG